MSYPFKTGLGLGLNLGVTGKSMGNTAASSISRYFRYSDGGTSFVNFPAFTVTGDFKIVHMAMFTIDQIEVSIGQALDNSDYVATFPDGTLRLRLDDNEIHFQPEEWPEGELFQIVIERVGPVMSMTVGGLTKTGSISATASISFDMMNQNGSGFPQIGIVSNVVMYDDGVLTRNYAVDDNSNTIVDSVSGQNGTVVNSVIGDWGEFDPIEGGWKGKTLTVPPWASTDQVIVVSPII
ncbi:MAG: hypothetical protein JKY50_22750 [Oleispira sp.]|nr:hypothetical protein [Oleispira sp.]